MKFDTIDEKKALIISGTCLFLLFIVTFLMFKYVIGSLPPIPTGIVLFGGFILIGVVVPIFTKKKNELEVMNDKLKMGDNEILFEEIARYKFQIGSIGRVAFRVVLINDDNAEINLTYGDARQFKKCFETKFKAVNKQSL